MSLSSTQVVGHWANTGGGHRRHHDGRKHRPDDQGPETAHAHALLPPARPLRKEPRPSPNCRPSGALPHKDRFHRVCPRPPKVGPFSLRWASGRVRREFHGPLYSPPGRNGSTRPACDHPKPRRHAAEASAVPLANRSPVAPQTPHPGPPPHAPICNPSLRSADPGDEGRRLPWTRSRNQRGSHRHRSRPTPPPAADG